MESKEQDQLVRTIGIVLLAAAAVCGVWVFNAAIQLWNDTANVPLIKYVISAVHESSALKTPQGTVELPEYMPLGMAIFLCLMVISGIVLLTKVLIEGACVLLLPDGLPLFKRIKSALTQVRQRNNESNP